MDGIVVSYDGRGALLFTLGAGRLGGPLTKQVMRETLRAAGDKTRTQVRRALRRQMGTKTAGAINEHTWSFSADGGLAYVIKGAGKGLPIVEFPVKVTGSGVWASPWSVGRVFKRSFFAGGYRARLGPSRFPTRKLYGPAVNKEIVKDEALDAFLTHGPQEVARILPLKIARLMP